jgi:hypothetical protein
MKKTNIISLIGLVSMLTLITQAGAATMASIKITCDDQYTLYVNGIAAGSGNSWQAAQTFNVQLRDGANLIAVEGRNLGGPAGLIADFKSATTGTTVTDMSWKYSTSAGSGWNTSASFNDSTWANAKEYGSYGSAPWSTNVSGISSTSAKWIWSGNASDNKVYFRKIIAVGPPGTTSPNEYSLGEMKIELKDGKFINIPINKIVRISFEAPSVPGGLVVTP